MARTVDLHLAFYRALGDRARILRYNRGLLANDVSRFLQTSRGYVSKMECGAAPLNMNSLLALSDYYDVPLSEFFPSVQDVLAPYGLLS